MYLISEECCCCHDVTKVIMYKTSVDIFVIDGARQSFTFSVNFASFGCLKVAHSVWPFGYFGSIVLITWNIHSSAGRFFLTMATINMETYNESSNEASNQMKNEFFYNEDSNPVTSESKMYVYFDLCFWIWK